MVNMKNCHLCIFIIILVFISFQSVSAVEIGVDSKTTQISIKIDENMNVIDAGHIISTVTNYENQTLNMTVELTIESSGSMPIEGEFGGKMMEIFPTKAIGSATIDMGETVDIDVSIGVSDTTIQQVSYSVSVRVDMGSGLEEVYNSGILEIPVDIQSSQNSNENNNEQNNNGDSILDLLTDNVYITISVIAALCAIIYYVVSTILKLKE
jgi:hypothetical protein